MPPSPCPARVHPPVRLGAQPLVSSSEALPSLCWLIRLQQRPVFKTKEALAPKPEALQPWPHFCLLLLCKTCPATSRLLQPFALEPTVVCLPVPHHHPPRPPTTKKKNTNELIYKTAVEYRCRKQTYGYRGRGGINWEIGINLYTLLYII